MNENGRVKIIYSWPVIFLLLYLFWPLGIFLLYKRLQFDRKAALRIGKVINGLGIGAYVVTALGIIVCLGEGFTGEDVEIILFFGIAGFVMRKVAKKITKNAEKIRRYLQIIVNGGETDLDKIARAVGLPFDTVNADIQKMIDTGYLNSRYISRTQRKIMFQKNDDFEDIDIADDKDDVFEEYIEELEAFQPPKPVPVQPHTIICKCCGAQNIVQAREAECEYCGSQL